MFVKKTRNLFTVLAAQSAAQIFAFFAEQKAPQAKIKKIGTEQNCKNFLRILSLSLKGYGKVLIISEFIINERTITGECDKYQPSCFSS